MTLQGLRVSVPLLFEAFFSGGTSTATEGDLRASRTNRAGLGALSSLGVQGLGFRVLGLFRM